MVGLQVWVFGHQKPPHNGLHDKMHLCFRMLWSEKTVYPSLASNLEQSCLPFLLLVLWTWAPSMPNLLRVVFFSFLNFFITFIYFCVWKLTHLSIRGQLGVLFTSNVDLGDQTWVIRLDNKCLCPLSHLFSPIFLFFSSSLFKDRISLCRPGWFGINCADQAILKLRDRPASVSQVFILRVCVITPV